MEIDPATNDLVRAKPTAPDLGQMGSREWMRAILVDFENHFADVCNAGWFGQEEGIDPSNSEMADWSGDRESLLSEENADNLRAIVEYLVAQSGRADLQPDPCVVEKGRRVALEGEWAGRCRGASCTDCHDTLGGRFRTGPGERLRISRYRRVSIS